MPLIEVYCTQITTNITLKKDTDTSKMYICLYLAVFNLM